MDDWGIDEDVAALLELIDCGRPPYPTAEALTCLHEAFSLTVPYNNLDIQLGRPSPFDAAEAAALWPKVEARHATIKAQD